jgi:hypothetical protein
MTEDTRKKIFIALSLIVGLLIVAILLALVFRSPMGGRGIAPSQQDGGDGADEQVADTSRSADAGPQGADEATDVRPPTEEEERRYVRQLAGIFVERFESYSSQNENVHLDDVLELATAQMQTFISSREAPQTKEYVGASVHVMESRVDSFDGGDAVVTVGVQLDGFGSDGRVQEYKSGSVELTKQDEEWKVSGWYWDE